MSRAGHSLASLPSSAEGSSSYTSTALSSWGPFANGRAAQVLLELPLSASTHATEGWRALSSSPGVHLQLRRCCSAH